MKKLVTPLLALVLAACSSSGNKETTQDSTAVLSDTAVATGDTILTQSTGIEIREEGMSDTSQLEITWDETAGLVFERQEPYFTVSIATRQYESSSDVTWYFDTDFLPIYFKEDWASEGNEGSTEFFIEAGSVMCAASQESGVERKWCRKTGGLHVYDGGTGDLLTELLPSGYGNDCDEELAKYQETLSAILREAEITQKEGDSYTVRIEKTVDVGMEVQESTEVTIPKEVYDFIVGG